MQFTRTDLISVIADILERDLRAREIRQTASDSVLEDSRAEWMEQRLPEWKAYRDHLSKLIRRNRPILSEDLIDSPRVYSEHVSRYSDLGQQLQEIRDVHPVLDLGQRHELEALKGALELVLDEHISDNQLGRLGFGASSISRVFHAATMGVDQ